MTQQLATSICNTAQSFCNGTNEQYTSQKDCLNFLGKETRLGEAYELGMSDLNCIQTEKEDEFKIEEVLTIFLLTPGRNTLLCRMVHQNMVPLRPSVHCPHIGKTGGGYCNDNTNYTSTVEQDFFTNLPFGYTDQGEPLKAS